MPTTQKVKQKVKQKQEAKQTVNIVFERAPRRKKKATKRRARKAPMPDGIQPAIYTPPAPPMLPPYQMIKPTFTPTIPLFQGLAPPPPPAPEGVLEAIPEFRPQPMVEEVVPRRPRLGERLRGIGRGIGAIVGAIGEMAGERVAEGEAERGREAEARPRVEVPPFFPPPAPPMPDVGEPPVRADVGIQAEPEPAPPAPPAPEPEPEPPREIVPANQMPTKKWMIDNIVPILREEQKQELLTRRGTYINAQDMYNKIRDFGGYEYELAEGRRARRRGRR